MSRVFDQVNLGDIKDLYRILIGAAPGTVGLAGFEDAKIPINEVVQMLTLWSKSQIIWENNYFIGGKKDRRRIHN